MTPWCSTGAAHARAHDQQPADPEQAGLEGDHRRLGELRVRAVHGRQREPQHHQARRRSANRPSHWRRPTLKPNMPLGHHGDEHHARRRARPGSPTSAPAQRGHVQAPAGGRDQHAEREPLRGVQLAGRAQRVARRCTLGTELAPRYLKKKPRFATKAQASARRMPRSRVMGVGVQDGGNAWLTAPAGCFTAAVAASADQPIGAAAYPGATRSCEATSRAPSKPADHLSESERTSDPC